MRCCCGSGGSVQRGPQAADRRFKSVVRRGTPANPRRKGTPDAASRGNLLAVFGRLDPGRVPWFEPSISAATVLTGRLMETCAHGQDGAGMLSLERQPPAHPCRVTDVRGRYS